MIEDTEQMSRAGGEERDGVAQMSMADSRDTGGHGDGGSGRVGLVLSGGAARGAYEVGVLSVLAPVLEERGESPRVIVGTSAGGLNAAFIAAGADEGLVSVVDAGCELWQGLHYGSVLGRLISPRDLGLVLRLAMEFLGVPTGSVRSVLDNAPLVETIREKIKFDRLAQNVRSGVIDTAGVAATSYDTGRSVVFYDRHAGALLQGTDERRAIDYAYAELAVAHVRASSAIEALFPPVEVTDPVWAGWYGDGGTGLNTPLKPALTFGAERLIVIGLNSLSASPRAPRRPADAFDGAAAALQALFADQLANDVATLASINQLLANRGAGLQDTESGDQRRVIPYIFVAPRERFVVGRLASDIYREHYPGLRRLRRGGDVALLGRLRDATRNYARGELFSYVFFAPEFTTALIDQGRRDAQWWLSQQHDDWPWRTADPPSAQRTPVARPQRRRAGSPIEGGR